MNVSNGDGQNNVSSSSGTSKSNNINKIIENDITCNSTVNNLESKLKLLRDKSNEYNQILTQKLASSKSGQNLLHIGTSLSSLPPDLHSLTTSLSPIVNQVEQIEKQQYITISNLLVHKSNVIQYEIKKMIYTKECAEYYQELVIAETNIKKDKTDYRNNANKNSNTNKVSFGRQQQQQQNLISAGMRMDVAEEKKEQDLLDSLDHIASLERAAHITLNLVNDLQLSSSRISVVTTTSTANNNTVDEDNNKKDDGDDNNNNDNSHEHQLNTSAPETERAQFLMKLSPRIRKLESDTIGSLIYHMEKILKSFQQYREEEIEKKEEKNNCETTITTTRTKSTNSSREEDLLLLMLGHVMRGLTLLGRGKEVESIFARVAIMPLIRSKVSMGRLDEGGSRGECAGLASLLDDMVTSISNIFGPILIMSEAMFSYTSSSSSSASDDNTTTPTTTNNHMDVDLITEGVWIPIVTTFMAADTGIKMAIFSPGIANILQTNYMVLDKFLNHLAQRLLLLQLSSKTTTTAAASGGTTTIQNTLSTTKNDAQDNEPKITNMNNGEEKEERNSTTSTTNNNEIDVYKNYYDLYYHRNNNYTACFKNKSDKSSLLLIMRVQDRIYAHSKTIEFYKKWNLPIYYQLRFGECCNKLNHIISCVQKDGWSTSDLSMTSTKTKKAISNKDDPTFAMIKSKFELPFFQEFYDVLITFWKPKVFLKPLTNRFLRGVIQLLLRTLSFIVDSMDGKFKFGVDPQQQQQQKQQGNTDSNDNKISDHKQGDFDFNSPMDAPATFNSSRTPYCWGESEGDVGVVAWELTVLKSMVASHYVDMICDAIDRCTHENESYENEQEDERQQLQQQLRSYIFDTMKDLCDQHINPIINKAWNEIIVKILTSKCSQPLGAVKGVAATYRMTNRPPPTQASPFVATILRPLQQFDSDFKGKTPVTPPISASGKPSLTWKHYVIITVSERYSVAVEELLATVQRTEVALKNRKTRARPTALGGGGVSMTDGEKVKLQVYLDYQSFYKSVQGILPQIPGADNTDSSLTALIPGLEKLRTLTIEGEALLEKVNSN